MVMVERLIQSERCHPLPRIRHFRKAGIGGLLRGEKYTNRRLRRIMSGPNLEETKHTMSLPLKLFHQRGFHSFSDSPCPEA